MLLVVQLANVGIPDQIMDALKPQITVSDWFGGRFDCGYVYECNMSLLDGGNTVLAEYSFRKTVKQYENPAEWNKVTT